MAKIICAFPGTGKTYACEHANEIGLNCIDLDISSGVDKVIEDIKSYNEDTSINYVFMSLTEESLLNALVDNKIEHTIIIPSYVDKEIYIKLYENNNKPYVEEMKDKYDSCLTMVHDREDIPFTKIETLYETESVYTYICKENGKLTDDEIDELCKELGEVRSVNSEEMKRILEAEATKYDNISTSELANVIIKDNGEHVLSNDPTEIPSVDNYQDVLQSIKGLGFEDDKDAECLLNIIFRLRNEEKFSVFNAMTPNLQNMIRSVAGGEGMQAMQTAAKELVEAFMKDIVMDKEFDNYIKQINEIKKEMPSMGDILQDLHEENMSKYLEIADKIRDEQPDKAEMLDNVISSYKDASTFKALIDTYKTNGFIRRKLKKWASNEKDVRRALEDINFKYKDNKFTIKNATLLPSILVKVLPDDTLMDDVNAFCVLLGKTFMNLSPTKLEEHCLMYYTINNICLTEFSAEDQEFRKNIINNILNVINVINNKEVE